MISETNDEPISIITCAYKEPKWSGISVDHDYGLDVLKNGVIIDNLKLTEKPFYIIGRYKTCDLIFEHPSLSRFHSVLQYCSRDNDEGKEKGWYLMDLDSTHGTILNKKRIPSHTFVRVHTGHVIKFGGSTRLYVVTGPENDKEQISQYSWTELMEFKNSKTTKVADAKGYLPSDDSKEPSGCMWGMNDHAEDDENSFHPKSDEKYKHEDLYQDDPKKVIKIYFEKEGFDEGPQYEFTKVGFNRNICKLELPVFGENGEKIVAEVSGSDKKKDMITRCALEACHILDEMDELYKAGGAARRQKKDGKYYEQKDYYSSDEDDFLDRTGQIEQKRVQRMRRFGVMADDSETAEDGERPMKVTKVAAKDSDSALVKFARLEEINDEILTAEQQLADANRALEETVSNGDGDQGEFDEIEHYLAAMQAGAANKQIRQKLMAKMFELTREENLLRKQLRLSIPVTPSMRASLYRCKQQPQDDESEQCKNVPNKSKELATTIVKNAPALTKTATPQNVVVDMSGHDTIESDSDDEETSDVGNLPIPDGDAIGDSKRKVLDVNEEEVKISETKRRRLSTEEEEVDLYSDWVPPEGQTGDGKTSLNDKLGY